MRMADVCCTRLYPGREMMMSITGYFHWDCGIKEGLEHL